MTSEPNFALTRVWGHHATSPGFPGFPEDSCYPFLREAREGEIQAEQNLPSPGATSTEHERIEIVGKAGIPA